MQDKTSKKPKGTKNDIELLGATTKVKSTNLKSTNSNFSSSNYGGSSEIAFMDPRALYDY